MTTHSTSGTATVAELAKGADQQQRLAWYAGMARWAPSKHNSQPWRFAIRESGLELATDSRRALRVTDPLGREMLIALGAAAHVATVAMRSRGYEPTLRVLADGRVRLTEGAVREVSDDDLALCREITRRRTDRGPLDAGALPLALPFVLQSASSAYGVTLRLVTSAGDRKSLAALVERADRLLVQQRDVDDELRPWLRDSDDVRADGVPASSTRGAAASYRAEFVQRDFSTSTSRPAQDLLLGPDAALVGVLCTSRDASADWLATGQALSSVLLHASASGASASYLNQPIELPALRAELHRDLLLPGPPQLVLRIGVGSTVAPPPRRDVKYVLTYG